MLWKIGMIATNYSIKNGCITERDKEKVEEIIKSNVIPIFSEPELDDNTDFPEVQIRNNIHYVIQTSNLENQRWIQRNRIRNQSRTFLNREEIESGMIRNINPLVEDINFIGPLQNGKF
jgi:hypothetical protein